MCPETKCDFNWLRAQLARFLTGANEDDCQHIIPVINSMTPLEREVLDLLLDFSRRKRIAEGAGMSTREVETILAQQFALLSVMRSINRIF